MRLGLLVGLALVAPFLAGCVNPSALNQASLAPGLLDLAAEGLPLWPDHQNEPHPAFGWPTLTHPAVGDGVPALWKPIPPATLPSPIQGLAYVAKSPDAVARGAGTALFGSLAVVPGSGERSSILDISDPANPTLLGQTEESNVSHRGAAIIAYPNGTLVALFSTTQGMQAFDITDPATPVLTATVELARGHKLGVVPGTPIVYNANSRGAALPQPAPGVTDPRANVPGEGKGQTEILDFSDPWNPVLVKNFTNGYGCHHIFFWNDASQEKYRAICAGIQYTQIWDVADPLDPKVVVSIPMHHGNTMLPSTAVSAGVPPPVGVRVLSFSHTAMLSEDGKTLIVGDEFQGGGGPAECDGTPLGPSGPLGNLWFYDVSNEKEPQLKGWISPPPHNAQDGNPNVGCTAHHGRLVPDPEGKRDLLVMAWYNAGVVLIDFTDPANPWIVDEWDDNTNTWEAWYYNGYVFTGDLARGMDVLLFK